MEGYQRNLCKHSVIENGTALVRFFLLKGSQITTITLFFYFRTLKKNTCYILFYCSFTNIPKDGAESVVKTVFCQQVCCI